MEACYEEIHVLKPNPTKTAVKDIRKHQKLWQLGIDSSQSMEGSDPTNALLSDLFEEKE